MDAQFETKQKAKDILSKISQSAVLFLITGLLMIVFSSGWDILFGTELSHPIWQQNYNWLPLMEDVFIVAVFGGAMTGSVPALAYAYANRSNKKETPLLLTQVTLMQTE